jgi:hypothetical protein
MTMAGQFDPVTATRLPISFWQLRAFLLPLPSPIREGGGNRLHAILGQHVVVGRHTSEGAILNRSLAELLDLPDAHPQLDSYLNGRIAARVRVPLRELTVEDLRLLIGQGIGLLHLVPLALEHLREHPFAAGDMYRGDLLKTVAQIEESFWASRPKLRALLIQVLELAILRVHKVKLVERLGGELREALRHHRARLSG